LLLRLRSPRTSACWTADYRTITNRTITRSSIGPGSIGRRISAYWTADHRTITNRAIARWIIAYRSIACLGLAQCSLTRRSIGRAIGSIRVRRSAIRSGGVPDCRHTRPGNLRPAPRSPRPRLDRLRGLGVAGLTEQFAEHNTQMEECLPQTLRGSIAPLGVSADLLGRAVVAQRGRVCHGQVRRDLVSVFGRIPPFLHDRRQQTLAINERMQRVVNETLLYGPPFSDVLAPHAGAQ
jgi:hypothetical protein